VTRPSVRHDEGLSTAEVLSRFREPLHVVRRDDGSLEVTLSESGRGTPVATLPPLYPEWLGDRSFNEAHSTRFPYVAGEMANGIASTELVTAVSRADMLAFFGAAGLSVPRIREAVATLRTALPGRANWGVNLIHAPQDPRGEWAVVDLLIEEAVGAVSLSAFTDVTATVVRLAASGTTVDSAGTVRRARRLLAKVSRPELARKFMEPPPQALLDGLVSSGTITPEEAALAARLPIAEDITVEADSGGHTDNRSLAAVFPAVLAQATEAQAGHGRPLRCGAAGGMGTPHSVATAFGLGAAYVVTGTVNQSCLEAGTSAEVKEMLSRAGATDTVMAPAPDAFEAGSRVQVLRHGSLFGPRANQLHAVYREFASLEDIPVQRREQLERTVFRDSFENVWNTVVDYWTTRGPGELTRAEADPKHRMALVFRWYLGRSSWWAIEGEAHRRIDYQVWAGPAMGAFNAWVRGSFLEDPRKRDVVQVARNLLEGAAVITRAQQVRSCGVPVAAAAFAFVPRRLA
jgi:trans-AT polyketide synthase/acyltransferase/oxidoreductase domain-containing protein